MQNPIAEPLKLQSTSSLVWPKRWIRCAGALLTVALFLELCMAYAAFEFPLGWGTLYGIGWLGSGFAGYRLARLHGDIEAPCKCLGHFLEWWPWAKDREEFLAWMILACLLGAALFALLRKSPHRIFASSPN